MSVDLKAELAAIIDKSLPALEANRLRVYIEEAEKNKAKLITQEETISNLRTTASRDATEFLRVSHEGDALKAELKVFKEREKDFIASELRVLKADFRAEKADAVTAAVQSVVQQFTKNPEIRSEHYRSHTTPVARQIGNGYEQVESHTSSSTDNKREIKE